VALLWVNLGVYLGAILVSVVALNALARAPGLRLQVDATKTRAYSLSPQTRALLGGLRGEWKIALVMVADQVDRATLRQVEEVLRRFSAEAPAIDVVQLDPTDPASLGEYEALLAALRLGYGDLIDAYESALDEGVSAFGRLLLFAQGRAAPLEDLTRSLPVAFSGRPGLERRASLMALLAQQGAEVLAPVSAARRVDEGQPLPDHETARSILAEALGRWALELQDVARILDDLLLDPATAPEVRPSAQAAAREYRDLAAALAAVSDRLRQLPPLELAQIGRELRRGEAAVVMGLGRAVVIPSAQLFPRTNVRQTGSGAIAFDQRFRGEQLLASAIRTLITPQMPRVVFVHAEAESLLRRHPQDMDLTGVVSMLSASRIETREWLAGREARPEVEGLTVWVVLPPTQRPGLEPTPAEQALVSAVAQLVRDGEPVLLSVRPSLLPRFRRADPWADLARVMGVAFDTGRVLVESRRVSAEEVRVERAVAIDEFSGAGPIGRSLASQRAYLELPVPIQVVEGEGPVRHEVIASIAPAPGRWLEADWNRGRIEPPAERAGLEQPVAVVMAAERAHPAQRRVQRLVAVGSGGWMLSRTADMAVNLGGDRYALLYPGNVELLLASVLWLAGQDDLMAPGPAGQQVSRVSDLSNAARRAWFAGIGLMVPASCLGLGVLVWLRRRA
jgi:hypothetical protein